MRWFVQHQSESADQLFGAITWLGSAALLAPLVIASMLVLMFHRRMREAYFLGVALVGTIAIVHVGKLIVARPRPDNADALIAMPWDQSFPSAHAAQIAGVMLASLMIVLRLDRIWFSRLWLAASAIVFLVALSRIYLQVHYPSDVLVGIAVGALWVPGLASLMLRRANELQK
jgi:membrane-associated phospholipid phosphatase